MRLAVDISKVGARDGIGSWTRGLVNGLVAQEAQLERVLLYDLAGNLDERLPAEFGDLGPSFEFRLGARPADEPDGADVFLATSWQIPAGWRRPVVFVAYDLTVLSHPECHTVDNRIHTLEGCLQALVKGASFLAISEATAQELEHHFDVPRSVVQVVYPGLESRFAALDTQATSPSVELQNQLRDRFGLPMGYVLAVGSLEPRKNLERLIDAHGGLPDELRRRHPLVVVGGGGWHNAALDQALHQAESKGDVHRMGRVTGSDLVSLYRGAALFAYPSLAEGFGLPVLEAMACGTPVLTSDRSSMPEVAGDAARLVSPTDVESIRQGLGDLLTEPETRAEMSRRGLQRAQDFSWTRAAAEIVDLCVQTTHPGDTA